MSATSSSSSGRECSKSWCHNLVDLNYKMCTSCRQKSRSQTAKSRNLKRQKEVEEVDIENFPAQVPRTVYRESPRSAGREQEALMRILNEMPDESSSASKEVPHNLKPMVSHQIENLACTNSRINDQFRLFLGSQTFGKKCKPSFNSTRPKKSHWPSQELSHCRMMSIRRMKNACAI